MVAKRILHTLLMELGPVMPPLRACSHCSSAQTHAVCAHFMSCCVDRDVGVRGWAGMHGLQGQAGNVQPRSSSVSLPSSALQALTKLQQQPCHRQNPPTVSNMQGMKHWCWCCWWCRCCCGEQCCGATSHSLFQPSCCWQHSRLLMGRGGEGQCQ